MLSGEQSDPSLRTDDDRPAVNRDVGVRWKQLQHQAPDQLGLDLLEAPERLARRHAGVGDEAGTERQDLPVVLFGRREIAEGDVPLRAQHQGLGPVLLR